MTAARADIDAALLLLDRLGVSPADLHQAARNRRQTPTFAEYVPVVTDFSEPLHGFDPPVSFFGSLPVGRRVVVGLDP